MADDPQSRAPQGTPLAELPEPIQEDQRLLMNAVLRALDEAFNGSEPRDPARRVGFFLCVFPNSDAGRFNYISNSEKLDVHAMLKEVLARIEGRLSREGAA